MALKIFCLSDTHGCAPARVSDQGVTAWLHAGDIFNVGSASEAREMKTWSLSRRAPIFSVRGNHDCGDGMKSLDTRFRDISGKVVEVAPRLFVAGIGWSGMICFDIPGEAELETVCKKILLRAKMQMTADDSCILLTHYPAWTPKLFPTQTDKWGRMFDCIRELIDALRPLAVIQGHIHQLFMEHAIYRTYAFESMIAFPGPGGAVLYVDLETRKASFAPWIE